MIANRDNFNGVTGNSFLKSSEDKDDSEYSRKSQLDLSSKKSILKPTPQSTTATAALTSKTPFTTGGSKAPTSNARLNLMAKDDKKIHFDLNESLEIASEVTI